MSCFHFRSGSYGFALIDFCCVHDDERCNESNHRKIYAEDDFSFGVKTRTLFLFADVLRFLSFASKKSCALHALCGAVIKHGSVAHIGMRKSCVKFLIAGSFGILSGKLVSRANDTIVFLHKIVRGGASQSFGIEVASLAGVTKSVIDHAKSIMHSLEEDSKNRDTNEMLLSSAKKNVTAQVSLFDNEASKIEQQIKDIDVNNLTPLQALTVLCDLKKQLE